MSAALLFTLLFLVFASGQQQVPPGPTGQQPGPTGQRGQTGQLGQQGGLQEQGKTEVKPENPLPKFNVVVNGFHFENGDLCNQVEALHYCQKVNEDFGQCIIFDRTGQRLMGVEYIVSEKIFKTLGDEEQSLWHSHAYEFSSGLGLVLNVDPQQQVTSAQSLVNTYGKTWHTFDEDAPLPFGIPSLMMSFTNDKQIEPELVQTRDKVWNVDSNKLKSQLQNLKINPVDRNADSWKKGISYQLEIEDEDTMSYSWQQCEAMLSDEVPERRPEQRQPGPQGQGAGVTRPQVGPQVGQQGQGQQM